MFLLELDCYLFWLAIKKRQINAGHFHDDLIMNRENLFTDYKLVFDTFCSSFK